MHTLLTLFSSVLIGRVSSNCTFSDFLLSLLVGALLFTPLRFLGLPFSTNAFLTLPTMPVIRTHRVTGMIYRLISHILVLFSFLCEATILLIMGFLNVASMNFPIVFFLVSVLDIPSGKSLIQRLYIWLTRVPPRCVSIGDGGEPRRCEGEITFVSGGWAGSRKRSGGP